MPHFLQEFSDLVQADTLGDSVEPEAKVDDSQATSLSITEQARGVILVALVVEVVLLIVALVVKVLVLVVMLVVEVAVEEILLVVEVLVAVAVTQNCYGAKGGSCSSELLRIETVAVTYSHTFWQHIVCNQSVTFSGYGEHQPAAL